MEFIGQKQVQHYHAQFWLNVCYGLKVSAFTPAKRSGPQPCYLLSNEKNNKNTSYLRTLSIHLLNFAKQQLQGKKVSELGGIFKAEKGHLKGYYDLSISLNKKVNQITT